MKLSDMTPEEQEAFFLFMEEKHKEREIRRLKAERQKRELWLALMQLDPEEIAAAVRFYFLDEYSPTALIASRIFCDLMRIELWREPLDDDEGDGGMDG